ncbi:MAG: Rieske 2Fe-2S domain-containing protein [Saprospiraceae bacterium]|nr:Rieske 2Fe-2S domain-containing protein [Saprospiraceae bacterium]
MKRRDFIVTGSQAGVGICLAALLGEGCAPAAKYAAITVEKNKISLRKSEFQYTKKGKVQERNFLLIKPEKAVFPICLYKKGEEYIACLMRCTHQDCEVELQGTRYICPCHGSEFSNEGIVLTGPAEENLRTFKTTHDATHVHILVA